MQDKECIVLVIGGSVLTDRKNAVANVNTQNINTIISEIKKAKQAKEFGLVIVTGMGSFGHPIAKKHGINEPLFEKSKMKGRKELITSLKKLNGIVITSLRANGIKCVSCGSIPVVTDKGKVKKINSHTLRKLLAQGYVPVLHAYPAYDKSYGLNILSSDHLGPIIAKELKCKLLIGGTSVDGVFDKDPKEPDAKLINKITPREFEQIKKAFAAPEYVDVTGGILRKVSEYMELAQSGVQSRIINLTKPNILSQTIVGKPVGTLITRR